ncbi:PDZ domain-containing protein [Clostridium sp. AM58-1XD]|nr:M50 family metallopeptidase [Clostridium sp. AM58-1XD]RGZ01628.1 PDZ domain-containing protein [Clostridium sp. AM58-1XD]
MNIVLAILVFGLIVLIHEFGHFLLAKMNGIGVVEFSIGMGPRIVSIQKGETRYSIKALPFGGSCMMLGEDENESDPKAFNNKPVWGRISVIFAGPFFNFVLAFLFAMVITVNIGRDTPYVYGVTEGLPASQTDIRQGDKIVKMNNQKISTYRDVLLYTMSHAGEEITVTYQRAADGDWKSGGRYEEKTAVLKPEYSEEQNSYVIGLQFYNAYEKPKGIGEVLTFSAYEIDYCIRSTFESLKMLFSRQVAVGEAVAGPVKIVSMIGGSVGESREIGVPTMLLTLSYWCLILSASLGIMNLLPIPALDGGRLVFLFIELIRGKPIDREKEGMVHMAGLACLMVLMVFVLFNDIRSFF